MEDPPPYVHTPASASVTSCFPMAARTKEPKQPARLHLTTFSSPTLTSKPVIYCNNHVVGWQSQFDTWIWRYNRNLASFGVSILISFGVNCFVGGLLLWVFLNIQCLHTICTALSKQKNPNHFKNLSTWLHNLATIQILETWHSSLYQEYFTNILLFTISGHYYRFTSSNRKR